MMFGSATRLISKATPAIQRLFGFGQKLQGPAMPTARMLPGVGMSGKTVADVVGNTSRMAGDNLKELAAFYGPDALYAGLGAVMAPGDLGDKALYFATDFGGQAIGGKTARALTRKFLPKSGQMAALLADMGGSHAGYLVGAGIGDQLARVKGGGTTPYEKLMEQERRALEQQILAQHGLAGYSPVDLFLQQNGLA
jgi:hypothetical protein